MGNTDFINYLLSQGAQPAKSVLPHAPASLQPTRSPLQVFVSSPKSAPHLPYPIPELIPDSQILHSSNCSAVGQFPLELSPIPLMTNPNPVGLEESMLQPESMGLVVPIVLVPNPTNTPMEYYANNRDGNRKSPFLCLTPLPSFSASPITPLQYGSQQMFFPPDFSISHLQPHRHVGLDFVDAYGKMHSSNLSPYMYQYCANAYYGQRPNSA